MKRLPLVLILFRAALAPALPALVLAIILLLPSWQSDVHSAWHALRLRRGLPIRRHRLLNG